MFESETFKMYWRPSYLFLNDATIKLFFFCFYHHFECFLDSWGFPSFLNWIGTFFFAFHKVV